MKLSILFLSILSMCSTLGMPIADDEMIEFRLPDHQYVIVVSVETGATMTGARLAARKRMAAIATENGERYFAILSEKETEVEKTAVVKPGARAVPALRVVFKTYAKKPGVRVYDACAFTNCRK